MSQFNQVTFIGRLGKDPEMSFTPTGKAVTKFSIAVNRPGKDAQGHDKKAMWFNVVCWEKLAQIVDQYAHKGAEVFIQGYFDQSEYKDKDGVPRVRFDVVASTVQLLGTKKQEDASAGPSGEPEDHPF